MYLKSAVPALLLLCMSAVSTESLFCTPLYDINGFMPEQVYIATQTQTFCKGFSFCIYEGKIWVKKDKDKEWSLFLKTGLPHPGHKKKLGGNNWFEQPEAVQEIAADGDALFAFDTEGRMYRCYLQDTTIEGPFNWLNNFGWPKKQVMHQNDLVSRKRGWGIGVRRKDILWYEDRFGNQHHYGTMGLETIYFLTENGQDIRFTDSGLPADFSRTILGPERGSFIAENMSVSGSTLFLINKAGEMYTRLIDFDTMGCDPMFFKYTYKPVMQKYSGKEYLSNYTLWGLPSEDWYKQPDIPLTGQARLSRFITIFQNGQGNSARELRVAGLSADGKTGFYYKGITGDSWNFFETPLKLNETAFLEDAIPGEAVLQAVRKSLRGARNEYSYTGYIMKNNERLPGITCSISDFPITTEGSCTLIIEDGHDRKTCILYPLEIWTYMIRYNPGFDGTPKNYFITPSFSDNMVLSSNPRFSSILNDIFAGRNLELYAYTAEVTDQYIEIDTTKGADIPYTFFMTRTGTDMAPESFKSTVLYDQPLLQDSTDKTLILDRDKVYTVFDAPEIQMKIENNRKYIQQLREELEIYKEYHRGSTVSRWGFKTVDLLTSITLLNKIDFPKIKTVTMYGNEIMDTNARNFRSMAEYRSLTYPYLIMLIQTRIDCYNNVLENLPHQNDIHIDSRLRDSYPEYFEETGIAEKYCGFSQAADTPGILEMYTQFPAFPGFQLKLNGSTDGQLIFIEIPDIISKIFVPDQNISAGKSSGIQPLNLKVIFYPLGNEHAGRLKLRQQQKGSLEWNGKTMKIWTKEHNTGQLLFEGTVVRE
jgi:hypothetical protein